MLRCCATCASAPPCSPGWGPRRSFATAGPGNRAQLNFGDCFAYALAKTRNLPLLFKGDNFIHTDIVPALPPA